MNIISDLTCTNGRFFVNHLLGYTILGPKYSIRVVKRSFELSIVRLHYVKFRTLFKKYSQSALMNFLASYAMNLESQSTHSFSR